MTIGKIHSFESFGTVDGPGIRFVTFMQGCPLRCLYCHNPDTWEMSGEHKYDMTPNELLAEVMKYKNFIASGGVTVTGGEPLMQPQFLREFFELCRREGIHTALDTSGYNASQAAFDVLDYTDLVLLDIKSINPTKHKELTAVAQDNTMRFMEELKRRNIPTWVRHVILPTWTDNTEELTQLAEFVKEHPNVERVELLPYHTMGEYKYESLGLDYKLSNISPPTKEEMAKYAEIFKSRGIIV